MTKKKETIVFAFIVDGEVFHTFDIEQGPGTDRLVAGLRSEPKIVEVLSEKSKVIEEPGWKYLNGEFIKYENIDPDDYEVE